MNLKRKEVRTCDGTGSGDGILDAVHVLHELVRKVNVSTSAYFHSPSSCLTFLQIPYTCRGVLKDNGVVSIKSSKLKQQ